jgi:hypothetical protein
MPSAPDGAAFCVPGVWRDEEWLMKVMRPWLKRQAQAE